ncbi:MAG: UDP-N-acetylmuramoyl-L-alanyl-D-glutamate--2,6-diaminopimelate ligase [Marinifilaceae bacterium]
MKLKELLKGITFEGIQYNAEKEILNVNFDSRKVTGSDLFVAQRGVHIDGHDFIESSVEKGATAVVCEVLPLVLKEDVSYIVCADASLALGIIASNFYGNPSHELKLVGVTGTNGKTTTATLLYRLIGKLGFKCGLLSTVSNFIGETEEPATHTTPDALAINSYLRRMVDEGCKYCFMEISSHSIAQERIAGLYFAGGIFSNITHDHLDYHKTFKNYIAAKQQFFTQLPSTAFALTNIDDKNGMIMVQNSKAKIVTYSCKTMADYHCQSIEKQMDGTLLMLDGNEVWTHFTGDFNMYNLLSVYGAARELGFSKFSLLNPISELRPVCGRFDTIMSKEGVLAVVDYAHTPDAVENVLKTINEVKTKDNLVITVVGAGGDRDKTKRPEMAACAARLSDRVILTSDNPRTENPIDILNDMLEGVKGCANVIVEADRAKAIHMALELAKKGDVVLIAGKGHENYQDIQGVKHHFDDKEVVQDYFKN